MPSLARRNLMHDKVRLAVTLTGVVFAVVLVAVQIGLFIGFIRATADIIDSSRADLWIVSKGVGYIEVGQVVDEGKRYQALGVDGVERVDTYILQFSQWTMPNGAEEGIQIIGFNLRSGMGGPWNVVEGDVRDLELPDTVIVDRLYCAKLGVSNVGDTVEIRGRRARIVGFTEGIRTFTTSPAVFTSFKNALGYAGLEEHEAIYFLVKVAPGADIEAVRAGLLERVADVDVLTTAEFSRKTTAYWLLATGAGVTVLIAAFLGLVVGVVVVAQTIYAATVDHIREFGTLKAMGASNGYIIRVILKQAAISACIGYALGIAIAYVAVWSSKGGGAAIVLPWEVAAGLFLLTLAMCMGAAVVSINKVTRTDPALVFKA